VNRVAAGSEPGAAGKGAVAVIFVVGMALALLLLVRATPGPEPFDPRSGASTGANALVKLLDRSSANVTISRTPPDAGTNVRVLVLIDKLDDVQRSAVLAFADAGGVVVVADPASGLHGGFNLETAEVSGRRLPDERRSVAFEANVSPGSCTVSALSRLRGLYVPDGVLYSVTPDEPHCFGDEGQSFVVVQPHGNGTVIGLGDNEVFVNKHLRRADNAGLAVSLLVPTPNAAVVILTGGETPTTLEDVGTGEDTLIDLVPSWVWMALLLFASGFTVFAISRSVRVGKVVDEPLATTIAGSELVAATGNLMQRAKHATRAGWLLQVQLHRDLCREYHVSLDAAVEELDSTVSAHRNIDAGTVASLLRDQVSNDTQLVGLSSRIDRLRREVLT
jgi:hypothetical protein